MRVFRLLAAAGSVAGLVACSLLGKAPAPYPRGVMFPLKSARTLTYEGRLVESMLTDGQTLYLAAARSGLLAVKPDTFEISWTFKPQTRLAGAPQLHSSTLVCADVQGAVYALDQTGRLLWKREIGEPLLLPLAADARTFYGVTESGSLFALSSGTGEQAWRVVLGGVPAWGPVIWEAGLSLLQAMEDGTVAVYGYDGKRKTQLSLGSPVAHEPLVEQDRLFCGTMDRVFRCFDLAKRKNAWKVRMGGTVQTRPVTSGRGIFVWTSHGVLYALNKGSGNILWWKTVPSRLPFPPVPVEDKLILSATSPLLTSYVLRDGEDGGSANVGLELHGPVLWREPFVYVNAYDFVQDKGELLALQKEIGLSFKPSKESPQGAGEEIVFMAKATGLFNPRYQFVLIENGKESVAQAWSESNTWDWYPDKEGKFKVRVEAADAKDTAEAEMDYEVVAQPKKTVPVKKESKDEKGRRPGPADQEPQE